MSTKKHVWQWSQYFGSKNQTSVCQVVLTGGVKYPQLIILKSIYIDFLCLTFGSGFLLKKKKVFVYVMLVYTVLFWVKYKVPVKSC